jgi:hypothetical protein
MKPINPHRTRKTSMRTRKMRGEDNLKGSVSRAIACPWPVFIAKACPEYGTETAK